MIQNKEFIKRKIGTQFVIVAVGEASRQFNGMISVNSTGAFIWDVLEKETDEAGLIRALTEHYEVDAAKAKADWSAFLKTLREAGAIIE